MAALANAPNPPPAPLKLKADLTAPASFASALAAFGVDGEEPPANAPNPEGAPNADALPKAEAVPNAEVLPNAGLAEPVAGAPNADGVPKADGLPKAGLEEAPVDCGAKLNALAGLLLGLLLVGDSVGFGEKAPNPKPGVDLNAPNAEAVVEGLSLLGAKLNAEVVVVVVVVEVVVEDEVEVEVEVELRVVVLASPSAVGDLGLGG